MVFKKNTAVLIILIMVSSILKAQYNMIPFAKTYGTNGYYYGKSVIKTRDKGYLIAGATSAMGAGSMDILLIKVDSTANIIQWMKTYGGLNNDWAYAISNTPDSAYLIAGYTNSSGAGGYDAYLMKIDSLGNKIWDKTFGGQDWDFVYSMSSLSDGNYIMAGETYSNTAGLKDAYLIKVDNSGNRIWEKKYGGLQDDLFRFVIEDTSHHIIAGGSSSSYRNFKKDAYVVKINQLGDTLWTKIYGDTLNDEINCVATSKLAGGIWAAGYTEGKTGTFGRNKLILKLDGSGNQLLIDSLNTLGNQELYGIFENRDTTIYTMGNSSSTGFGKDVEFFLFDRNLNFMYAGNSFGFNGIDECFYFIPENDSCFVAIGNTNGFGNQLSSVYFIRSNMERSGLSTANTVIGVKELSYLSGNEIVAYPNPFKDGFYIKGKISVADVLILDINGRKCNNRFNIKASEGDKILVENLYADPGVYFVNTGKNSHCIKMMLIK